MQYSSEKQNTLWNFLKDNLPFALAYNKEAEFSKEDYIKGKAAFKGQRLDLLSEENREMLYTAVASLMFSTRVMRGDFSRHEPMPVDEFLDSIPSEYRSVIDSPAPLARQLKKVIMGQDNPNFKSEYESDYKCQLSHSLSYFLTQFAPVSVNKNVVIRNVLQNSFPEIKITMDNIIALIKEGRSINFEYLDNALIKEKILSTLFEALQELKDRKRLFRGREVDDVLQETIVRILGKSEDIIIEKDKAGQLLRYAIRVIKYVVLELLREKSHVEFNEEIHSNTDWQTVDAEEIINKWGITIEEQEMIEAYLSSKSFSEAERKLNNKYSRYKIEQAYQKVKALTIKMIFG